MGGQDISRLYRLKPETKNPTAIPYLSSNLTIAA